MSKRLLIFLGIGLLVAGVAVALIYFTHVGSHLELKSEVLKIRTGRIDDNISVALIDFRIENISDVRYRGRNIVVKAEFPGGEISDGEPISQADVKPLLAYNPLLGQQYNPTFTSSDKIQPREKIDRSLVVRFDIPLAQLEKAKQLRITLQDMTGAEFDAIKPVKP